MAGAQNSSSRPWQAVSAESPITPEMSFSEAAAIWLKSRGFDATAPNGRRITRYVKPNTENSDKQYIVSLGLFFGEMRLSDIRLDHLRKYQNARVAGDPPFIRLRRPHDGKAKVINGTTVPPKGPTPCPCKPQKVNQEMNQLIRILKRAKLWSEENRDLFEHLMEEESEMPRALRLEEQNRWLQAARSHPRWNIVHWYSVLAFNTCMGTNEIRSLRIGDINLPSRILTVPVEGSKNKYRHRTIPIVDGETGWAIEQLLARAYELGAREPSHYLFPFRDTGTNYYVPEQHMTVSAMGTRWDEVRAASGLSWFRPYDTRHTAITRLAEAGTAINVIMEMAGHVSVKMMRHYTHISGQLKIQALQQSLQRLGAPRPPRSETGSHFGPRVSAYAPPPYAPQWPPAAVPSSADPMNPVIEAEIARQVALALQRERDKEQTGPRLVPPGGRL